MPDFHGTSAHYLLSIIRFHWFFWEPTMPRAWITLGTRYQVEFNKASKILDYQRSAESTFLGINAERNEHLEHLEEHCKMEEQLFSLSTIHNSS